MRLCDQKNVTTYLSYYGVSIKQLRARKYNSAPWFMIVKLWIMNHKLWRYISVCVDVTYNGIVHEMLKVMQLFTVKEFCHLLTYLLTYLLITYVTYVRTYLLSYLLVNVQFKSCTDL